MTFCRRLPVTLLADDVGLGKTISAGLVMSELVARGKLSRVLIVCPKVLRPQWQQELDSKFGIPADIATGKELLSANPKGIGAVITTYNTARLYLEKIPEDRFEMLILDEAHKLRNLHGTPNAPQVAKVFHKALGDRRFRFVLMLTATPIQNRLWDLYSLVDLLTVARGHENPFGAPGMFARRFIADEREKARQLKPAARDEFRSIVYGYMSRVRRGDAQLYFPDRVVQMHRVKPTAGELALIELIARPIQKMNRLAQISVLQALVSSPDALRAQLTNMARNGTVPQDLARSVADLVGRMPPSAKLTGLGTLIEELKRQNATSWRLVVFTTRRETQTTIQNFLEGHGLKVGLINGESGARNQETIERFQKNPPGCRVIVSTEAGSEGVNLQVANVLVNYDLPWNPMIVEQRVGRIQRLGSEYAHVNIFNITLQGTFEEYIVGRLVEKLQMASHAIGDVESLLQGADVDGDEDASATFEELILDLVLKALAGKNVEEDVRLQAVSIENAKRELEREEANMNALLGGMDGGGYVGPRSPKLPPPHRSMELPAFTLAAFKTLDAKVSDAGSGLYQVQEKDGRQLIAFDPQPENTPRVTVYAAQAPAFQRLVKRVVTSGMHCIEDTDVDPGSKARRLATEWIERMGAKASALDIAAVTKTFAGEALLRVRATTAHDSYERLVSCSCQAEVHRRSMTGDAGLAPLEKIIREPNAVGIDVGRLRDAAEKDQAIAEFSRFYLERGAIEVQAAGQDERKRQKLVDDFTPRLEVSLVGLDGRLHREVQVRARYGFPSGGDYEARLTLQPGEARILNFPDMARCGKSGANVPTNCLARCEASGTEVLRHLLADSELSGRRALPEFTGKCSYSGKSVLLDELETSTVTGRSVARALLKTSIVSGKKAEPDQFGKCSFTNADVLMTELAVSELSGNPYRADEQVRSEVSGKSGHRQEFITCHETRQTIAASEAETCEQTHARVRPGVLVRCEATGKRVVPSLIGTCSVTQRRVLMNMLVSSSVSSALLIRDEAIRSHAGLHCLPREAQTCSWSGQPSHPDDLRICSLTGLPIRLDYLTTQDSPRLRTLAEMLDGIRRNADEEQRWGQLGNRFSTAFKGAKCRMEAAVLSPTKRRLAACCVSKTMLGLRTRQIGAIYDLDDDAIIGKLAEGKRGSGGWLAL
jgi:superfamily II DNA or RNA helicase